LTYKNYYLTLLNTKGFTIDLYTVILLLFIFVGILVAYNYYLKERHQDFSKIEQGFCPKCKQNTIELIDIRGTGCSPKIVTFKCTSCGYEDSFTKPSGCSL